MNSSATSASRFTTVQQPHLNRASSGLRQSHNLSQNLYQQSHPSFGTAEGPALMAVTSLDEEDTFPSRFLGSPQQHTFSPMTKGPTRMPQESMMADSYLVLGSNIEDMPHEDPSLVHDDPFNKFWDQVENLVEHFASVSTSATNAVKGPLSAASTQQGKMFSVPRPQWHPTQRPPSPNQVFFSGQQNIPISPTSGSVMGGYSYPSSQPPFMSYYMVPSARPEPRFVSPISVYAVSLLIILNM